jgi:hypothetical protein
MNGKRRPVLLRVARVVVLVLIVWATYRALAPQLEALRGEDLAAVRPNWLLLLPSTLAIVAVYLMHAMLWRMITAALTHTNPPLRTAMRVYFVSSLGRYLRGKLWQIAGMAALSAEAGIPAAGAVAASILAQVAFMTTGALLLAVLLPTYGVAALLGAVGLLAVVVAGFVVLGTPRGARLRHRLAERAGPRFGTALDMIDRVRPRAAALWWLGYLASWLVLASAFALFVIAFEPAAARYTLTLGGTVAASYLLGYITPLPAGIGAREGVMAVLLSTVLPPATAVVVSASSRLWFTAGELLPLMLIPLLPRPHAVSEVHP